MEKGTEIKYTFNNGQGITCIGRILGEYLVNGHTKYFVERTERIVEPTTDNNNSVYSTGLDYVWPEDIIHIFSYRPDVSSKL
jgi:hypothetical protein